jgi:RNA polymerase sigma-70 factor (sigma-E family)
VLKVVLEGVRYAVGRIENVSARPAAPAVVVTGVDRSLRSVFEADYGRLVNAAAALVHDRADAEEIAQEAFARSFIAWKRNGVPREPAAYVRVAVVNLSRTRSRRNLLRRSRKAERPEPVADPEEAAVSRADQRALLAAISSLPRRQRECVALRYLLDESVAETAATLAISEGSVKTHTHRALRGLEQLLGLEKL